MRLISNVDVAEESEMKVNIPPLGEEVVAAESLVTFIRVIQYEMYG